MAKKVFIFLMGLVTLSSILTATYFYKKIAFDDKFDAIFSGWKTSSMPSQIPYHKLNQTEKREKLKETKIKSKYDFLGEVAMAIDESHLLIIDKGIEAGLEAGMVLSVFRKDCAFEEFAGNVQIKKVEYGLSLTVILPEYREAHFAVGDKIKLTQKIRAEEPKELKFTPVPFFSMRKVYKKYKPFVDYISKEIGIPVKLKLNPEFKATVEDLGEGVTDFCYLDPAGYIMAREKYKEKIKPIAIGLVDNSPFYTVIIVTPPESNINTLDDLKGRAFVFGSRYSIAGSWMPKMMLLNAKVKLSDLRRYDYVESFVGVAEALMHKDYDAGAIVCFVGDDYVKKGKLRLLARSSEIPHCPITINTETINPTLAEKIRKAIISLDINNPEHEKVIHSVDSTYNGFGLVTEEMYSSVGAVIKRVVEETDEN